MEQKPEAKVAISSERNWATCISFDRNASEILDDICAANDICEQDGEFRASTEVKYLLMLDYKGLVYFEPKESFPLAEELSLAVEALKSKDGYLQEFLFGIKQSREERCNMVTELTTTLQERHSPGISSGSRPMLLSGHPLRILNIDFVLPCSLDQRQFFDPALPIGDLHKFQNLARISSKPNIAKAVHNARLGQSLLRRFWDFGNEDDLHEAIFFFTNALAPTPAHSYRRLEIYLDISQALFFRYQLFQRPEDFQMLLTSLQLQNDALESSLFSWVWEGIDSLQLLSPPTSGVDPVQHSGSVVTERPDIVLGVDIGMEPGIPSAAEVFSAPSLTASQKISKELSTSRVILHGTASSSAAKRPLESEDGVEDIGGMSSSNLRKHPKPELHSAHHEEGIGPASSLTKHQSRTPSTSLAWPNIVSISSLFYRN